MPTAVLVRALRSSRRMPRCEMQELISRGDDAISAVTALLAAGGAGDALWGVVVLGELRAPAAIDPLARLLGRPDGLGVVAAEALGKIGDPAVALLARVVRDGDRRQRLCGYGALAMIHTEEAYACLQRGLRCDRELRDVVAQAIARHGQREAIEALWQISAEAPGWMRREFESAIATLAHGATAPDPVELDWRIRYRRLPRLQWRIAPSWLEMAGMAPRRLERRHGTPPALRSIDEIVADVALHPNGPPCALCGGLYWRPTGVPLCRHTARALLAAQRGSIERWLARGVLDVWTALDACDAADMRSGRRRDGTFSRHLTAIARATLYWLVVVECEDLRAGVLHLRVIADDLGADAPDAVRLSTADAMFP